MHHILLLIVFVIGDDAPFVHMCVYSRIPLLSDAGLQLQTVLCIDGLEAG